MESWLQRNTDAIAARAERELAALVAVSSPSGDGEAAEEAIALCTALAPPDARVERIRCSTPGFVEDLVIALTGDGSRRLLLVGHLDTVVGHHAHRLLEHDGDRLYGSGTIDMKGGDVIALGLLRALAERPELYAEVALLLVVDEEWRVDPFAHVERFSGFDACLCFEAGELAAGGEEAVVVRRKAATTIDVVATGLSSHSGAAPDDGRNALLALAEAARLLAACHDPHGADRLTVVPTLMRAGEGLNVVPGAGSLTCDARADRAEAFAAVLAAVPAEIGGVRIDARLERLWPGMDCGQAAAPMLAAASRLSGIELTPASRGGASDASHFAATIPVTIDGLGPRGGGSHAADEHVLLSSIAPRARVALALAEACLSGAGHDENCDRPHRSGLRSG